MSVLQLVLSTLRKRMFYPEKMFDEKKIFETNNTLKGNRNATLFECKLHWVVF